MKKRSLTNEIKENWRFNFRRHCRYNKVIFKNIALFAGTTLNFSDNVINWQQTDIIRLFWKRPRFHAALTLNFFLLRKMFSVSSREPKHNYNPCY